MYLIIGRVDSESSAHDVRVQKIAAHADGSNVEDP
jgi:hypothetical protein